MTETIIGLIRHGQTDWNIDFRLQGTTDIPLNETGVQQGKELGLQLVGETWDGIISSSLSRAVDTAQLVSEATGIDYLGVEPLLIERSFGIAEGLTHDQWREQYASLEVLPGGESLAELASRANQLLEHLSVKYAGLKILAVSHGALIRKVVKLVSNSQLPEAGQRFQNASLSLISHSAEAGWRIKHFDPTTYRG